MSYDPTMTFTEQGLRPDMVFDFYFRPDRADPRYSESKADEVTMSIEEWKAKWSPSSNYKPLENAGGTAVRQEQQYRSMLEAIARQTITQFELDAIPAERLQDGSIGRQLRVKLGGERIAGRVAMDQYISLRLEHPHLNIWLNVLKATNAIAVYFEVGMRTENVGPWIGKRFTTLGAAKAHFFALIKEAKEGGLLGG